MQAKCLRPVCMLLAILCIHMHLFSQTGEELYKQAQEASEQSNPAEAIRLGKLAAEKIRKDSGTNNMLYANILDDIASTYININEFEKAKIYSDTAIKIIEVLKGIKSTEYAYSKLNVGNIAVRKGQFEQAEKIFLESLETMNKYDGEKDSTYIYALNSLGVVYYYTEEYNKAIPLFTIIIDILKNNYPKRVQDYVSIIINLGELYRNIGSYNKSMDYLTEALELFNSKKIPVTHPGYTGLLYTLGVLQMTMMNYTESADFLKRAKDHILTYADRFNPDYIGASNNLGYTQYLQKNYAEAIASFREVLGLWKIRNGDTSVQYAITLNNLALVYIDNGDFATSDSLLKTAMQIYERLPNTGDMTLASLLYNQGSTYQLTGNSRLAFENYKRSGNLYIKYITRNFYGLSAQDKLNLTSSMQRNLQAIPALMQHVKAINTADAAKEVYHVQLALKNMVLRDQQSLFHAIHNTHDSVIIQLYTDWKKHKSTLTKINIQQLERTENIKNLEKKIDQLEQSLAHKSTSFLEQQQYFNLSVKDISGKLQPHETAIEFLRFPINNRRQADTFFYAALVIQPRDSVPRFVPLCTETALTALLQPAGCTPQEEDKLIMDLYQPVKNGKKLSKGEMLYNKIWKPLLPYMKQTGTVYISPAGLLYQVAFQAIPAGKEQMLGDKYTFRHILSTGDLAIKQLNGEPAIKQVSFWANMTYDREKAKASVDTAKSSFVATGNVYFDYTNQSKGGCGVNQAWPALSLGQKQVTDIASLCRQNNIELSVFQRSEATEETLKNTHFDQPSVLHISTHGFFIRDSTKKSVQNYTDLQTSAMKSPDPLLRSGIILSGANAAWKGQPVTGTEDGIVTAYEIAQMDLSNTHLVILDACESALGSIYGSEGVFGLQRAFRIAGANKIIMSLWKVPEKETNELMINFYKHWLTGVPVYKALKDAQQEMRKNLPPYYWAGFIVAE